MFTLEVITAFDYLCTEFGFEAKVLDDRTVEYRGAHVFVSVHYSTLQEIYLDIGLIEQRNVWFGLEFVIALTAPEVAFSLKSVSAFKPEAVRDAIVEQAHLFRKYGERVCREDVSVFAEIQALVRSHRKDRQASAIRYRAQVAMSQKKYAEALAHYSEIGDSANELDLKRIAYCRKKVG